MTDGNENQWSRDKMLEDLLGKPPLIRGEDEGQYWRFHAAIQDELKPTTGFDWIWVRELVDKLWEKRRNKQSVVALVESSYVRALADLLELSTPPTEDISITDENLDAAREYFDRETTSKRRKELDSLLAQYGITADQIRAKAMQVCGPSIAVLRQCEDRDDRAIRRLYKDYERRVARKAKKSASIPKEEN